jgi:hypothetical protein
MILEFLADDPDFRGGRVQELPTKGGVSAVNIPNASMVFELHELVEISAELFDGNGRATEPDLRGSAEVETVTAPALRR